MITGPKFKIARRLGSRVFPKTQTTKFSISGSAERRKTTGRRPRPLSEYGAQLIEKQKARYTYGLKEHQFASLVRRVRQAAKEEPSRVLYQTLERRLDNVIFRLGLTPSRAAARQLITHGHILVGGRRLNIPSYQIRLGDTVSVKPASQNKGMLKSPGEERREGTIPEWLEFDREKKSGTVRTLPSTSLEGDINFGSILEFYSRV